MKAKIVKESLDESLVIGGHKFDLIHINNQKIKVGKDGIIGDNRELISWNTIKILLQKYA